MMYWPATIAKIPDKCHHKGTVEKWCDDVAKNIEIPVGLLLMGDYSQGKSAIGSICLKAAASEGIVGFWVSARSLTEYKIEKTRFDDFQTVWERACSAPLVVLDEVQIREEAKYGEQTLEDLIRYRVENGLGLILTTNHGKDELIRRAPSLMAVLREAVVPIVVAGHDFRKERAKEL
jgi:DNA replication protein DnaC